MFNGIKGGGNDISKLLGQGEIAHMRRQAQLKICITEAYTITLTMGWIETTSNVYTKE
jgi:hypothetical protein